MGPSFCPAQPHTPGALGSWSQSHVGPALLCSALATEPQWDPNTAQHSLSTTGGAQAVRGEFLGGSALQEEKGSKLSLGKFPAILGTRDGLHGPAPGLGAAPDLGSQVP